VAAHREIWRWMTFSLMSAEQMEQFIRYALRKAEEKNALVFAVFSKADDQPIGGSGFWNIETPHLKLDIGGTWITPRWQRTVVNTEMKYLMLRHAFEIMGCRRVGFMVDELNEKSRVAVQRIGAKEEGLLRNHMVMPDGRKRHSVSFSIIEEEWSEVKARLEGLLVAQGRDASQPRP
jgi:RimJ/RimL family protein N-acetyltransferase